MTLWSFAWYRMPGSVGAFVAFVSCMFIRASRGESYAGYATAAATLATGIVICFYLERKDTSWRGNRR